MMFIPTNAEELDNRSIQSYSKPPTRFDLFRASLGRCSTIKYAKLANYVTDVLL